MQSRFCLNLVVYPQMCTRSRFSLHNQYERVLRSKAHPSYPPATIHPPHRLVPLQLHSNRVLWGGLGHQTDSPTNLPPQLIDLPKSRLKSFKMADIETPPLMPQRTLGNKTTAPTPVDPARQRESLRANTVRVAHRQTYGV
jgi:hypothetical protein